MWAYVVTVALGFVCGGIFQHLLNLYHEWISSGFQSAWGSLMGESLPYTIIAIVLIVGVSYWLKRLEQSHNRKTMEKIKLAVEEANKLLLDDIQNLIK